MQRKRLFSTTVTEFHPRLFWKPVSKSCYERKWLLWLQRFVVLLDRKSVKLWRDHQWLCKRFPECSGSISHKDQFWSRTWFVTDCQWLCGLYACSYRPSSSRTVCGFRCLVWGCTPCGYCTVVQYCHVQLFDDCSTLVFFQRKCNPWLHLSTEFTGTHGCTTWMFARWSSHRTSKSNEPSGVQRDHELANWCVFCSSATVLLPIRLGLAIWLRRCWSSQPCSGHSTLAGTGCQY